MHDPLACFMTPGWKLILQEVFLGKPYEMEVINAVSHGELMQAVANTLG